MIFTNKKEEEIIGNRRWADRRREHENVSVAPVPEPSYPGPQPGPEQAQGQGRYQFRGSEGSSSQYSKQSEMNNGDCRGFRTTACGTARSRVLRICHRPRDTENNILGGET